MGARGGGAAMSVSIDLGDDEVFTALRAFLVAVLPTGTEVFQLQDNGVPTPLGPFVGMNNSSIARLSTNVDLYVDQGSGSKTVLAPSQYTMSVDCYGPDSGKWASLIQSLFRDEYGIGLFPANIVPLYADNPTQIPLITGEQTYEQRWRLQCVMQTNPTVTITGQQFADTLSAGVINVDASYPPT